MVNALSKPAPIPARRVLAAAVETNERLGHENLGFLSESHGFMPGEPPVLRLPSSHDPWDAVAARLPELFRNLAVRESIDGMPVLSAGEHDLADRYLLRASAILSIFAHAYFYVDPDPPGDLPDSILQPWAQISRRLDRPAPHLSFTDLNLYNWKLIDPQQGTSVCVENIELLIPILGNEDERRFQMAPVEMMASFTPAVGAVVRAQEAVDADDTAALKRELSVIISVLRDITYHSFMKVDPNGHSRHYVNPVVWGKTVAPLATPFQPDPPPGPSGTAIPAFQLLDIFFGRSSYETNIGRETARVRRWFPKHWQDFLGAVEAISVSDFVDRSSDGPLRGLFQESLEAYGGEAGLLGRHRLKTYGFLDLSFKAGRSKTLGGFGGSFDDRLGDTMDAELDLARAERSPMVPQNCHLVRLKRVEAVGEGATQFGKVVLDVAQTGIRYWPGSRCAILPENSDDLVERTLRALQARGDEPIQLNRIWREAVKVRDGYEHAHVLSLRTPGDIRLHPSGGSPVGQGDLPDDRQRDAAKGHRGPCRRPVGALGATGDAGPDRLQAESALEGPLGRAGEHLLSGDAGVVPDVLDLLGHEGPARGRCRRDPPHRRAPALRDEGDRGLTRRGAVRDGFNLPLRRSPIRNRTAAGAPALDQGRSPPHFCLPSDPRRPIVMFAGGTGLSPFLSMISARIHEPGAGENWLFLATRTRNEGYYRDELARWVNEGNLNLRVAFSADDIRASSTPTAEGPRLILGPGSRRHIGEEMLQEKNARCLLQLLGEQHDGGLGASFYVCGRTGFATSVMEAIKALLHRDVAGSDDQRREHGRQALCRLIGDVATCRRSSPRTRARSSSSVPATTRRRSWATTTTTTATG